MRWRRSCAPRAGRRASATWRLTRPQQPPDDLDGELDVGLVVGDHVGVEEALADAHDDVGERGAVDPWTDRATLLLLGEQAAGPLDHALLDRPVLGGEDAQRGLGLELEQSPEGGLLVDVAHERAADRGDALDALEPLPRAHGAADRPAREVPEHGAEQMVAAADAP